MDYYFRNTPYYSRNVPLRLVSILLHCELTPFFLVELKQIKKFFETKFDLDGSELPAN